MMESVATAARRSLEALLKELVNQAQESPEGERKEQLIRQIYRLEEFLWGETI